MDVEALVRGQVAGGDAEEHLVVVLQGVQLQIEPAGFLANLVETHRALPAFQGLHRCVDAATAPYSTETRGMWASCSAALQPVALVASSISAATRCATSVRRTVSSTSVPASISTTGQRRRGDEADRTVTPRTATGMPGLRAIELTGGVEHAVFGLEPGHDYPPARGADGAPVVLVEAKAGYAAEMIAAEGPHTWLLGEVRKDIEKLRESAAECAKFVLVFLTCNDRSPVAPPGVLANYGRRCPDVAGARVGAFSVLVKPQIADQSREFGGHGALARNAILMEFVAEASDVHDQYRSTIDILGPGLVFGGREHQTPFDGRGVSEFRQVVGDGADVAVDAPKDGVEAVLRHRSPLRFDDEDSSRRGYDMVDVAGDRLPRETVDAMGDGAVAGQEGVLGGLADVALGLETFEVVDVRPPATVQGDELHGGSAEPEADRAVEDEDGRDCEACEIGGANAAQHAHRAGPDQGVVDDGPARVTARRGQYGHRGDGVGAETT